MHGYFSCIYVCTLRACIAHEGQKRVLNPLGLEFQTAVSHVGAGNWIWILWKSSLCSQPLNIFPVPRFSFLLNLSFLNIWCCHIETSTVYSRVLFSWWFWIWKTHVFKFPYVRMLRQLNWRCICLLSISTALP